MIAWSPPQHLDAGPGHLQCGSGRGGLVLVLAQLCGAAGIDDQPDAGVAAQQCGQPLAVQVVEVLVGDQDGVQPGHVLESVGPDPWIDQQPRRAGVEQHAGVAEVGDLH